MTAAPKATARRDLLMCLALALAVLGVFWQVRRHDFVALDDPNYVTEQARVQSGLTGESIRWAFTTTHAANWHPLTWLSHMLDVELFGLDGGGHHVTSVLLHAAASLLLFLTLRRATGAVWHSGFVAGLFALHPLHVQSVAWVSERKDVLSGLFWMLTLWAYVRYAERQTPDRYAWVFVFFGLGLLAKPMLVTLPFVLLLFDHWPLQRSAPVRRLIVEKIPLLVLSAASSVVTFVVQRRGGAVAPVEALPLGRRLGNAASAYLSYIGKMIWPWDLAAFYPYPSPVPSWRVAGAVAVLAGVTVLVIRAGRRSPYLRVGWLFYLGTLVPVIGLVQVGSQAMADRYTYIPLIGLFLMVAWGIPDLLGRWLQKKRERGRQITLGLAASLVLLGCTVRTYRETGYWRNSVTLFEHALAVTDDNYVAHNSLGSALEAQGEGERGLAHYVEALRLRPNYADAHINLGKALSSRGKTAEAAAHLSEAVRLKPNDPKAHNNLASALSRQGKTEEAIAHYAEALRLRPDLEAAHYNLANTLVGRGRLDEAVRHYSEALRLKPDFADARNNLGVALFRQGRLEEAIRHYSEVLRQKPDFPRARANLAAALAAARRTEEAIAQYDEALRLAPDAREALANLAWIRATHEDERFRDGTIAVRLAERALEIAGSSDAAALDTLAAAYAEAGRFSEAVEAAQRAIALAEASGQAELAARTRERLDLYVASKPYRETAK